MKTSEVREILKSWDIDVRTISINTDDDLSFGTCDISGNDELVYSVTALDVDGNEVSFEAGESLVTGALGKVAGYF